MNFERIRSDWVTTVAVAAVLLYAAVAGLRTLDDPDLPWQLRDARHLVQTGAIARHDAFSYTAPGAPWMYPQGAGLVFYALYSAGGYAALSVFGMLLCLATVAALLVIRPSLLAAAVAGLAVPLIAWRTTVRAEIFTTFLLAVFLLLLLRGTAESKPWLLPLLMAVWVNAHPGFVLGMVLIALFLAIRFMARQPLGKLARTGALSLGATLLNPFGPFVWLIPFRQAAVSGQHQALIREWARPAWTWSVIEQLAEWREPDSAFWVLLLVAAAVLAAALVRRQWAAWLLLAPFTLAGLAAMRFQALFAIVLAAVVAWHAPAIAVRHRLRLAGVTVLVLLAALRVSDLATNRHYFSHAAASNFGLGLSYLLPERAADFILRERPPGRLFHEYDLGGYLGWKLGPGYPVFEDGRALPFRDVIEPGRRAMLLRPDGHDWREFTDRWGIQTILVWLPRHLPFGPTLRALCGSDEVRLVYLDEVSAVFVRNRPENAAWLNHVRSGAGVRVPGAQPAAPEASASGCQAGLPGPANAPYPYLYYAQAAEVLHQLSRLQEATEAAEHALALFDGDPKLHLDFAQILASTDGTRARREALTAVALRPSGRGWFLLGLIDGSLGRREEAIVAYSRVAWFEPTPYEAWRHMAESYLALGRPAEALLWFERTVVEPGAGTRGPGRLGARFAADGYLGEARARLLLGDAAGAERALRRAVEVAPGEPVAHLRLADFLADHGRSAEARAELERARALGAPANEVATIEHRLDNRK